MRLKQAAMLVLLLASLAACSAQADVDKLPAGSQVTIKTEKGDVVTGRLVEAKPAEVVVARSDGGRTVVPRAEVAEVETHGARDSAPRKPEYRELTMPVDTAIAAQLDTPVASDSSRVEDRVEATVTSAVVVDGVEVVPAGSRLEGVVTQARESGRVKGRALVAFRFDTLNLAGHSEQLEMKTRSIVYQAPSTKGEDAKKIGIPAAAGAVIGAVVGGGGGAAKGAVIGGGAGTAYVLVTKGEEVRVNAGAPLKVRLAGPVAVQVPR